MKKSEVVVLCIMGLVYVGLIGILLPYWKIEGLTDLKVVQDFIRTVGNAQITATIALGSLLVAIAAIASKSQVNNNSFKTELMSLVRVIMYFIFTNIGIIILSYSKFIVSSVGVIVFFFILLGIQLIFITWKTFKLGSEVLNIQ